MMYQCSNDNIFFTECRVIFRRGLHEGYVYITSLKLVLLGPPCVGKTAFKSLLFNWPAPKKHHSTAISTRPIRGVERVADKKEGKIWLPITGADLLNMLSDAIRDLDSNSQQAVPPDQTIIKSNDASIKSSIPLTQYENVGDANYCTSQSCNPDPHSQEAIPSDSPVTKPSEQYTQTNPEQAQNIGHSSPDMSLFTPSHTEIAKDDSSQLLSSTESISHSKEMIDLLSKKKKSEQLHKATWIHVLDSGGQPQFADVSRFFLHGNAIHVIVTKLTESLFDKPCFCYSLNGKMLHQPSELKMTNLELIETFIRSVMSSKNIVASIGKMVVASKPLFVIVGTNYDKLKKQLKKQSLIKALREKNAQLLSTLHEFKSHFIFHDDNSQEVIFPVDNLCWWSRKEVSSAIRERITSKVGIAFSVPIPVRWYMFEISVLEEVTEVTEKQHGIISLETCYNIGFQLGMDRSEVLQCAVYLDSFSSFLFFPRVLPNVVFTDPQFLLDMLSCLISVSFVDLMEEIVPGGYSISPETQRLLREDGIFEDSLLDDLSLPFVPPLFTKDDFLKLLCSLCIIAPLSTPEDSPNRYFLPIVLPPSQLTDEDKLIFATSCDPMIIEFSGRVVPQV